MGGRSFEVEPITKPGPPSFSRKNERPIRKDCYRRVSVDNRVVRDLEQVIEAAGRFASGFAEQPEAFALSRVRVAIYPCDSEIIHAFYLFHSHLRICYYIGGSNNEEMSLGGASLHLLERSVLLGSASPFPMGPGFLFEQKTAQRIVRGISELFRKEVEVKLQTRQDINGRPIWVNVPETCSVFPSLLDFARFK